MQTAVIFAAACGLDAAIVEYFQSRDVLVIGVTREKLLAEY